MAEVPTYQELKSKIAALELALDSLRTRSKMKDGDRIFGRLAHEFNNLMMVIQGNISIMLHDTMIDNPGYERLKHMERYIKSSTQIMDTLLDYVETHLEFKDLPSSLDPPLKSDRPVPPPPLSQGVHRGIDIYRQASTGKYRTLLVDDEALILDVGKRMLVKIGLDVMTAENGMSAVDIYTREKGRIDLVILDMIMPGIDGVETYRLLKEVDPHVKVLISSGYRKDERVEAFLKEPFTGFLKKPFSIAHLSDAVKKFLRPSPTD